MKLKTALQQLLRLMLLACTVSLAGCVYDTHVMFSAPVKKEEAEGLREDYIKYPANMLTNTIDNNGTKKNVMKFRFNAADIQEILARVDVNQNTKDKIVFEFALDKAPFANGGNVWHLIAYGLKFPYGTPQNLNLITSATGGKYTIFDDVDYATAHTGTRDDPGVALASRNFYAANNLLYTIDKDNVTTDQLYAFSFNADQINEIINNNAYGTTLVPDMVAIYLGMEFVNNDVTKKRWHVIAYGSSNGKLLDVSHTTSIDALTARAESVFDKADPCPPCQ
jgi:hypothetical protein